MILKPICRIYKSIKSVNANKLRIGIFSLPCTGLISSKIVFSTFLGNGKILQCSLTKTHLQLLQILCYVGKYNQIPDQTKIKQTNLKGISLIFLRQVRIFSAINWPSNSRKRSLMSRLTLLFSKLCIPSTINTEGNCSGQPFGQITWAGFWQISLYK